MLSSIPTWLLVEKANKIDWAFTENIIVFEHNEYSEYDEELDLRQPDELYFYFGDCAGQQVFIPIEPEYDINGNPIVSEVIGYDNDGNEIWN